MSGQGVPVESTQSRGPGAFFADHPVLFAFSVGGAWAASAYSLIGLSKTRGWRRFGFMAIEPELTVHRQPKRPGYSIMLMLSAFRSRAAGN